MTTAPLQQPAVGAAPVLGYHPVAAGPTGLHVERTAGGLTIVLPIEPWPTRLRQALVFSATLYGAVCLVAAAMACTLSAVRGTPPGETFRPVMVLFGSLGIFGSALTIVVAAVYTQTVWVEVLPEVVRLTALGRRLSLVTVWPRAQITAVELRFHGVRVRCRECRHTGWIVFGNTAQRRTICRLLREELNLS